MFLSEMIFVPRIFGEVTFVAVYTSVIPLIQRLYCQVVLTGLLLTLRQCSLLVFHNLAFVVRSLLEQCSFFLYQKFPFCVYCNWYCTAFFELAISAQYCLLASFILSFFCLKSCECFSSRFILSFFHFYICIEKMNIVGFDIWNL